jgi:S1-C subfamily serine protease
MRRMSNDTSFPPFSEQLADGVAALAPAVVQVAGRRRRPASGVVHAADAVLTTVRALGREDHPRVRTADGRVLSGELAGWDPASGLAVIRVAGLELAPPTLSPQPARVGHLAIAVARSWSNAVTASFGIVSVIGGPLPTGRGRAIDEVLRTTAPMHDGFAGGAFADTAGRLLGIATATAIRGLGVVVPTAIAWRTAGTLLEHGGIRRGYLGLAAQTVVLPEGQGGAAQHERALLVVGVTPGGPAATAGLLVGDILLRLDDHRLETPEQLLELLLGDRRGATVTLHILRAGRDQEVQLTIGERPHDA